MEQFIWLPISEPSGVVDRVEAVSGLKVVRSRHIPRIVVDTNKIVDLTRLYLEKRDSLSFDERVEIIKAISMLTSTVIIQDHS